MTNAFNTRLYLGFFENELTNKILFFWLPRCIDHVNGGYLNCFSNDGSRLISKDKYTWSQGRFLWLFSKLATMELFSEQQRKEFLAFAKKGRDFLFQHVLIAPNDWRCIYLLAADGTPQYVNGYQELDMSISADCFVVGGFARYSLSANDEESWYFAKSLYESVWSRYQSGDYHSLPYPLSSRYSKHGKPMMLTNISCEMYEAALKFDEPYSFILKERISHCSDEVFSTFKDEKGLIREFRYAQGDFPDNVFGQHINPGHTLEDMWFQVHAQDILQSNKYENEIPFIVQRTMKTGWDSLYGGIYHFVTCDGRGISGDAGEAADEPQMKLIQDDWGSKLWWVHSEALYTTLLMYDRTKDPVFLRWFQKVFDYTFRTFPNPDPEIREWIQIRTREGLPQDKVVALPVKDPFHIMRNVILIIELLQRRLKKELES